MLWAPAAHAAQCGFAPSTGTLEITGSATKVSLDVDSSGAILVIQILPSPTPFLPAFPEPLPCPDTEGGGSSPTVTNTDTVSASGDFLLDIERLEPGKTLAGEGGAPEIETLYQGPGVNVTEEGPGDQVILLGGDAGTGQVGANLNAGIESGPGSDTDVVFPAAVRGVSVTVPEAGSHVVNAGGAGHFESPLAASAGFEGGTGNDSLTAGSAFSILMGGPGDDQLRGGAGDDLLFPDSGDDLVDGGTGEDLVAFAAFSATIPARVTVNLSVPGPQSTGQGLDTFASIESIRGSNGPDLLTGDRFDNEIFGGDGKDRIRGVEGRDRLEGESGKDYLAGGPDRDKLFGGGRKDRCKGGPGRDAEINC